jgi:hypothetical protein
MKKLMLALCLVGFSTSALAEKVLCVDTKHKAHHVEFIADTLDFVYVDGVEYTYKSEEPDGKLVTYENGNTVMKFVIDPNNRDWFQLFKIALPQKKNDPAGLMFHALCDNKHAIVEEQPPVLINFK